MKQKAFTIFDSKVGAYMQPFFMVSTGAAIRTWGDTVNDPKTQFSKHPGDFTLFEIGSYDEETGTFENYQAKINLGTALEARTIESSQPTQPYLVENLPQGANQ